MREARPDDAKLLHRLATAYKDNKQMNEARLVFERLHQLKPSDQQLLKEYKDATALTTMQQGGWGEAKSYRDMIKDTKEAATLEQEGKAVKTAKDVDSLIQDTLQKIAGEPGNINYKRALADLYIRAERLDEAFEVLDEAQKSLGGGDPQIDRDLANIRIKQFKAEIAALEQIGDAAGVAQKQEELDAFRLEDARERVQRYPNDLQFKFDLGVLLFEHGEFNDAIQQFQASQRNPKARIQSLFYLGRCFREKSQFDIASQQLRTAAEEIPIMDGTKKDILYELGQVSEAMGKSEDAAAFYKEIYSVDISFKDVASKIEQGV
jgi:tetratricopeptide (TPR) repeat protein